MHLAKEVALCACVSAHLTLALAAPKLPSTNDLVSVDAHLDHVRSVGDDAIPLSSLPTSSLPERDNTRTEARKGPFNIRSRSILNSTAGANDPPRSSSTSYLPYLLYPWYYEQPRSLSKTEILSGAPNQTSKNCDGSGFCYKKNRSCQRAASRYVNDALYQSYTSFTAEGSGLDRCTAIFRCSNDNYGGGLTGAQVKVAFARLWSGNPLYGPHCQSCGSGTMDIAPGASCTVTANYCYQCKDANVEVAGSLLGANLNATQQVLVLNQIIPPPP